MISEHCNDLGTHRSPKLLYYTVCLNSEAMAVSFMGSKSSTLTLLTFSSMRVMIQSHSLPTSLTGQKMQDEFFRQKIVLTFLNAYTAMTRFKIMMNSPHSPHHQQLPLVAQLYLQHNNNLLFKSIAHGKYSQLNPYQYIFSLFFPTHSFSQK